MGPHERTEGEPGSPDVHRDGTGKERPRAPGEDRKGRGPFGLAIVSVVLGVCVGLGAVGFRALIAVCENLFYQGRPSWVLDTNQHAPPSPWGAFAVLIPPIAAVVVVFLVERFAPEARGHGVPEVMEAIYHQKGVIRPIVALIKWLASGISIGSGGSVGREGPMIQVGSALASWAGQRLRVSPWQIITMVAAGGGAGIAATFNTPIGGVLFAVEVLMHEVSVRTLVPVALTTTAATWVARAFLGDHPAFAVPALQLTHAESGALLPAYLVLGGATALASILFIEALYRTEGFFDRLLPGQPYRRHVLGMLGVGLIGNALMWGAGHYYVLGVGYATIIDILAGALTSVLFLALLFVLKLLTTSLTLGSGASGGVFSPALFMGATLGGGCGLLLGRLLPWLQVDPAAFALAGMAGVVAGSTGAALTAVVMIFEMSLDYSVVLPLTITVAASHGLRRLLHPESIYTMRLAQRGKVLPQALLANAAFSRPAGEVPMAAAAVVPESASPDSLDLRDRAGAPAYLVLERGGELQGYFSREWALCHREELGRTGVLAAVARTDRVIAGPDTTLFDLLRRMRTARASVAVIVRPAAEGDRAPRVAGVLTMELLADVIADSLELFAD